MQLYTQILYFEYRRYETHFYIKKKTEATGQPKKNMQKSYAFEPSYHQ